MKLTSATTQLDLSALPATIAVVADTHSNPDVRGLDWLRARKPSAILHAGDIGAPSVLDELRSIAPVHAVRGNIDARQAAPDLLEVVLTQAGHSVLRLLLTHIALAGTRLRSDAVRWAKSARASLVVCGHSHVPFLGEDRGLTVFNPGSIGPRRFTLPILFGLIVVTESGIELEHVDCATGKRWLP